MMLFHEEEALTKLKKGDTTAFAMLYNHYKTSLLMEAYHKVRNRQEAEDMVQEIFTSLWQRRKELTISSSLKHYLSRAVHLQYAYKCRRNHVARKFITYVNYTATEGAVPRNLENKELGQLIRKAAGYVSAPACRKVFERLYLQEWTHREIAQDMNIQPQVVKNQASRALKVIRTRLREVV
ncbi:RNA polymerase sigma factor [Chitinophaga tropicalis]|uniref:Sigma-70 family RNA polymerase sigma factor n=1 Tax=Chitinophaga tropicalis TaxID=2683588 RepID=A0A7K1U5L9_9BACT|nr:sigma-70 family RNA polymerase sigma factor [Chitinophaga tropicalis]MVT09658.1 sigma-70 family RNA polymerase sigma factor [Chitinophaga tropicalis]